jgi:hypothetical protein
MLIVNTEQNNEAPSLDRLLQNWWARLLTWLRREPGSETQKAEHKNDPDRSAGLIL